MKFLPTIFAVGGAQETPPIDWSHYIPTFCPNMTVDWNAISAIGVWFGAIATCVAIIASARIAVYSLRRAYLDNFSQYARAMRVQHMEQDIKEVKATLYLYQLMNETCKEMGSCLQSLIADVKVCPENKDIFYARAKSELGRFESFLSSISASDFDDVGSALSLMKVCHTISYARMFLVENQKLSTIDAQLDVLGDVVKACANFDMSKKIASKIDVVNRLQDQFQTLFQSPD